MIYRNQRETKKSTPAGMALFVALMIVFMMGPLAVLLLPPLALAATVGYSVLKQKRSESGQSTEPKDMLAAIMQKFGFATGGEQPPARTGAAGRYDRSTAESGLNDMLSDSERLHLSSLSGDHDEVEHHREALKDLLEAGIIEKDEYRDRMASLRRDYRS